jgi:hypothetical protein
MCDYSLENVANRAAKVGEKLVSTQFGNSFTRGFAAIGEPNVAVCLLPGTELCFDDDVEYDHPLGPYHKRKLPEDVARFRQINLQSPYEHHDALEFPSDKRHSRSRKPSRAACVCRLGATALVSV